MLGGYDVNWLGQMTDVQFVKGYADNARSRERRYDPVPHLPLGEETFEWLTLLDAILAARGRFVMVEAGAGYGRWLVGAALAVRQAHPGLPCLLIGVEGDAHHYACMRKHFRDNGLDPDEHRLIHGAVSDRDGNGEFAVNDDHTGWWGQWLMRQDTPLAGALDLRTEPIRTCSIETLLRGLPRVDHMDFDIQSAEGIVIAAGIDAMTAKVKRVFVETHTPELHSAVAGTFRSRGWQSVHHYGFVHGHMTCEDETPFGPVNFQGGLQCWLNPSVR
ncbi:MAG: hypothetical protein ACREFJ_08315 [Acetobacteraceae bacterium]